MFDIILAILLIICLIIGSYTDFKKREVPDYISYGMIFVGIGIRLIHSVFVNDFSFLFQGIFGLAICFIIALVMYYSGQWGGGDSKVMMGIGAFLGLPLRFDFLNLPDLMIFFINLLIVGGVYGFIFTLLMGLKDAKKIFKSFKKKYISQRTKRYFVLAVTLFMLIISFFVDRITAIFLVSFAILIIIFYNLLILITSIEKISMIKKIPVKSLTEGDWLAEEVKKGKKVILRPNKTGLTTKQIKMLINYHIKWVKVRQGIPFVPSFLISYLALLIFGNWLLHLIV